MTDEKQTTEEEIKDEIILDDEEVMPVPEAKTEGEVLEELPEEIKKKLEKQKAEKLSEDYLKLKGVNQDLCDQLELRSEKLIQLIENAS